MASHTIRSDKFPVGTNVSAYPQSAKQSGGPPGAAAAAGPVAVAADGSLTFVGLADATAYTAYAAPGGVPTYVDFTTDDVERPGPLAPNISQAEKKRRIWLPGGAVDETVPRADAVANIAAAVSGTVQLAGGLILPRGRTLTKIGVVSGTTAVGTPTVQRFAIFRADANVPAQIGALLGVTADDAATAWAANSLKELTLTQPYTPQEDVPAWVGLLVAAGTMPTLAGAVLQNAVISGLGGQPALGATADAGQTNFPILLGARTSIASVFYAYVR